MPRRENLGTLSDGELLAERERADAAGDIEWAERCDTLLRMRLARRPAGRYEPRWLAEEVA